MTTVLIRFFFLLNPTAVKVTKPQRQVNVFEMIFLLWALSEEDFPLKYNVEQSSF